MSDVITVADLEETKKHNTFHVDVITGRNGDYATNAVTGQVQKTLPATINGLDWSYVGKFADGVTFTKKTDFALDASNTQWIYVGLDPFPKVVSAGTIPSAPDYQVVHIGSLQALNGLTEPSDLDKTHRTEATLSRLENGDYAAGSKLTFQELGGADFDVVVGGTPDGFITRDAGNGNTAVLVGGDTAVALEALGVTGTADAAMFEYALRKSYSDKITLTMSPGTEIYIESDIDLSDITVNGAIYLKSDFPSAGRESVTFKKPIIRFNDDGTSDTGRIGVNMPKIRPVFDGIDFRTDVANAKALAGDFAGWLFQGINSSIKNCNMSGFRQFAQLNDVGYAFYAGNNYTGNGTVYKHALVSWAFSTTFRDTDAISSNNGVVYDFPDVFHSTWENGIHEFNDIVIKDIPSGNTLDDMYFENNTTAAVSSTYAADLVVINGYQKNSAAGDKIQISTDTGIHGFDRIGQTIAEGTYLASKEFRTYTRAGAKSDVLKSSYGVGDGLQIVKSDGSASFGYVHCAKGGTNSRQARTTYFMQIYGNVMHGLPAGWTFTAVSAGVFDIVFDADIALPNIQVTSTTKSVSTANVASHQLTMKESSGGSWSSFATASGFRLTLKLDGSVSNSCHASICVTV